MISNLKLIEKFRDGACRCGAVVLTAGSYDEGRTHVNMLLEQKNVSNVIKAGCPLFDRMELSKHLQSYGVQVCETELFQLTLLLRQKKEVPLDKMSALVFAATGEKTGNDAESILKAAKKALKAVYTGADMGISGADFGLAENGTLLRMETDKNARLAAVLPRLHLTLLETAHVVDSMKDVAEMLKQTSGGVPGHSLPALITHLTAGNHSHLHSHQHGPTEEYILIIDEP